MSYKRYQQNKRMKLQRERIFRENKAAQKSETAKLVSRNNEKPV